MKSILSFLFLIAIAAQALAAEDPSWERSLVSVEVTRKQYDYLQPWSRRVDQTQKIGTIIEGNEVLTTAESLGDHTLIRLQKGRGRWHRAELAWIDYHANLAAIRCADPEFWKDTVPVELAETAPRRGTAQVLRWRNGILESRNVEINRLVLRKGRLTFMDQLHIEFDSEMSGLGWGEAIAVDGKVIAIAVSKDDHTITALPCSFIRACLADRADGAYQGLGYFSFLWQTSENPDTLAYLGLVGEPRGVIVIDVQKREKAHVGQLRARDLILEVDGYPIDLQGDYVDPDYGNLLLENLASRTKRAGDTVKLKIMRDAEEITIDYVLPKVDYRLEIVPLATFDQEPEYFIMGGLVFQPLTVPFLQSWGADWTRKAPFRLAYAAKDNPTPDNPSYIVLTMVLPDPVNLGYQDARFLIVDKLNGQRVRTLQQLVAAKEQPRDGFHVLEFRDGDTLQRLVLDAGETDASTRRVLQRYSIQKDRLIADPAKSGRLVATADRE